MERSKPVVEEASSTFRASKNGSMMTTIRKAQSQKSLFKNRFRSTIADNKNVDRSKRKYLHSKTNYRPVSSHKFRTHNKEKWVGSSFKVY